MMVVVTIIDARIFSFFGREKNEPDSIRVPYMERGEKTPLGYTLFLLFLLISTHLNTATHIPPMGSHTCASAQW